MEVVERVGRPTKYKPEYCEQLVQHMNDGYSFESFAGVLSVCSDTLYEWMHVHPEFSDARKIGQDKLRLTFEKLGNGGMVGKIKNFHDAIWIFQMKNRFRWTDKMELAAADDKPILMAYDDRKLLPESKQLRPDADSLSSEGDK